MIYLSRNDVEALLDIPSCIDAMQSAFQAVAAGSVQVPQRTVIRMADRMGFFGSMPVYSPGYGSAAKVMTIYPENHDAGLPSHQGAILLFDEAGGQLAATIEAGSVTELRTAAVSALATDLLANPGKTTLAILGSGVQARSHVRAMLCVRDVSHIRIWSRTPPHAADFGEWAGEETGLDVTVCDRSEQALEGADVVCTVTASTDPILEATALKAGCHINAVGSFTPNARELDSETVRQARVIVDSRPASLKESGDILIPIEEGVIDREHIFAELSDLVVGHTQGREDSETLTVFKSLGLAIEDLVTAKTVYDLAAGTKMGQTIG